jgi:hypothetical protein
MDNGERKEDPIQLRELDGEVAISWGEGRLFNTLSAPLDVEQVTDRLIEVTEPKFADLSFSVDLDEGLHMTGQQGVVEVRGPA